MEAMQPLSDAKQALRNQIYDYLTEDGLGTGNIHAINDYSAAPTRFHCSRLHRSLAISYISIFIEDSSGFDALNYGAKEALVNGIAINVKDADGNIVLDLNGGQTIRTNSDWSRIGAVVSLYTWGTGNEFLHARGSVEQYDQNGVARQLVIPSGWSFGVDLSDDFTGLVEHSFKIQGYARQG